MGIIYTSVIHALSWMVKIVPIIAIGIFITSLAVNLGLMEKFKVLIEPLSDKANLSALSALSVITCTFNTTAGYSILVEGLEEKMISEREVIVATLVSSFPSILSHLFTFFIPVVIPILGPAVGTIYICLRGLAALLKTCFGILLARVWLRGVKVISYEKKASYAEMIYPSAENNKRYALNKSVRGTYRMLKRIIPTMFVTLFMISIAMELDLFKSFSAILEPLVEALGLESEVILISATDIVNAYAGLILAGSFLEEGLISAKGVLIALLLGNIISFSTRFMKHSLPLHVSLFGPRLGGKTVAINAALTLVIDMLFIMILMII
ncbi:MAG: nucleoside recognition domain-containing protein [Candidatus Methanospirareceae archaeon]